MALEKKPLNVLEQFLPNGTYEDIIPYLDRYHIKLKITKARKTKYGDYRPARRGNAHQITVNGNLNQYQFLLTLVHEIAHLVAFDNYGFGIQSHGIEWKKTYQELMIPFLKESVFPTDLLQVVLSAMKNVKSSSCYDADLVLALRQYNTEPSGTLIQELSIGSEFIAANKKRYKLLSKRRTRYEAEELDTKKIYLFPALYEVEMPE